jgi:RHS repeat-associated protein
VTQDMLGSTRVVIGQQQEVRGRHDYFPFGEEIGAGIGGRTTGQGYSAVDNVRQRFTQKEHDEETLLDYFGARYYSSAQGRFTGVDPLQASASINNPQTFNRYTYALNRVTVAVDPNGLSTIVVTVTPQGTGNPTARVEVHEWNGNKITAYEGLAAGQHRDRQNEGGDTPYGVYRADRTTVTEGGTEDSRLGTAYGTGKVRFDAIAGDAFDSGANGIRIHGGGTSRLLVPDPYALEQTLIPTVGCVRVTNQDVNFLIDDINTLAEGGDPLDRVFIGTTEVLQGLANQTSQDGQYLNPDLRLALGMHQTDAEFLQLVNQNRRRRDAQRNDANPWLPGRPERPRPQEQRQQGNRRND